MTNAALHCSCRESVCVHQIDDADEEDGCDVADEDAQLEELAVTDDDDNDG